MKALILAAGYGTRLYPLTIDVPKPLLAVAGRPAIEYCVDKLSEVGVDSICVITNSKFYNDFLNWRNEFKSKIPIKIINDGTHSKEERLGAVGDMAFAIEKESIEDCLLVMAADNIFDFSLKELVHLFNRKKSSVVAGRKLTKERIKYYHLFEDALFGTMKPVVENIEFLPIQIYPKFMNLIANSLFVISDGGGLQEETYYFDKPCLLLRKRTEKHTGLGETAYLSEFDYKKIDYFFEHWREFKRKREFINKSPSKIIVDYLEKEIHKRSH